MAQSRIPDAKAEMRRALEGPLRAIVDGVMSRDGKRRSTPPGSRERAAKVLHVLQRHLDDLGVDRALTNPLENILEAFAETDRGRVHPLFMPKPLKGRPPAPLSQFDLMIETALEIDRLIKE